MNFLKTCYTGWKHLSDNELLYFKSVFFVILAGILFLINKDKVIIGSFQGVIILFSLMLGTVGLIFAIWNDPHTRRRSKKNEKT